MQVGKAGQPQKREPLAEPVRAVRRSMGDWHLGQEGGGVWGGSARSVGSDGSVRSD